MPEAWMPTVEKHSGRTEQQRTPEGKLLARRNIADRNAPITADHSDEDKQQAVETWRFSSLSDYIVRQKIIHFIINKNHLPEITGTRNPPCNLKPWPEIN